MLSGGIGSASIAVYETDHEGLGRACSAVSSDGDDLESRLIKRTVDRRGLKLHTVTPDQVDTLCGPFADRVRDLESPFDATMTLPAAVCASAAANGIRSLSAGVFANEVTEPGLGDILRVQVGQRRFLDAIQQFDPNGKLGADRHPTQVVSSMTAAAIRSSRAGGFLESRRDDRWRAAQLAMLRDSHLELAGDDLARVEERLLRPKCLASVMTDPDRLGGGSSHLTTRRPSSNATIASAPPSPWRSEALSWIGGLSSSGSASRPNN